jgi:hypothetical protein
LCEVVAASLLGTQNQTGENYMSRSINHTRINIRKRIRREASYRESFNTEWTNTGPARDRSWIEMKFGKHAGKSLPEILVNDPSFVINYLYGSICFKPLLKSCPTRFELERAHQLQVLEYRSQNIVVPANKRDTHEFAILKDKDGVFRYVGLVRRGKKISRDKLKGYILVKRTSKLDLSIPYEFENSSLGLERMCRCFKKIFFKHDILGPQPNEIIKFFTDRTNFDLTGCTSHTSLVMTEADTYALRKMYLESLKRH